MSDARCKSCKWWVEMDSWDQIAHPLDPDTYEPMPTPFEVRRCTSPNLLFYERPPASGATVVDGSQYQAALLTGPEFGCTNHE